MKYSMTAVPDPPAEPKLFFSASSNMFFIIIHKAINESLLVCLTTREVTKIGLPRDVQSFIKANGIQPFYGTLSLKQER